MKLAKVRHRVVATIIDNLIISFIIGLLLIGPLVTFIYALVNDLPVTLSMIISLLRSGMIYCLFLLFYYMVVPMFLKGQTIGKWLLKLKVVNEEGKDVGYKDLFFREAICRILLRILSCGASSVVSFIVMLIRDDKKSIADVFAKTKVIDIKEDEYHGYSA